MTIRFCPECHKEAYRIKEEGESIKITQGGSTVLSLNKSSSVSMSFNCPDGHAVPLVLEPEVAR